MFIRKTKSNVIIASIILSVGLFPFLGLAQGGNIQNSGTKETQDYIQGVYYNPRYPGGKSAAESYAEGQKVVEAAVQGKSYSVSPGTVIPVSGSTTTDTTVSGGVVPAEDEDKSLLLPILIMLGVVLSGLTVAALLQKKEDKG